MNIPDFSAYMRTPSNSNITFWTQFHGFTEAIHWTEPFIIGLLSLHVVFIVLAIFTRKNTTFQTFLWLLLLLAAWMAKYINMFGGKHWQQFASQDYFDKNGFFISMMYSLPIMCICLFIVANFVIVASRLLIEVKRAEFRKQLEKNKKKQN